MEDETINSEANDVAVPSELKGNEQLGRSSLEELKIFIEEVLKRNFLKYVELKFKHEILRAIVRVNQQVRTNEATEPSDHSTRNTSLVFTLRILPAEEYETLLEESAEFTLKNELLLAMEGGSQQIRTNEATEPSDRPDRNINLVDIAERLDKLEASNQDILQKLSELQERQKGIKQALGSPTLSDLDVAPAVCGISYNAPTGGMQSIRRGISTSGKEKFAKELWRRGDRAIATGSGFAFLGGLFAQLPGAIAGAVIGVLFGLFVKSRRAPN